jgi:TatD DNase family protein
MSTIAYPLKNAVYLNITNRCNNRCDFCIKFLAKKFHGQYELWLDREPTVEEIISSVDSVIASHDLNLDEAISKIDEIVFCGYGESLIRLDVVKEVNKILKSKGVKIRIDTDGLVNWHHKKNILPELQNLVDVINVSLNAQDALTYNKLCNPPFENAYDEVLNFIKEAKKYIPKVIASVVDLPEIDIEKCRKIVDDLGVEFLVRKYYKEKYPD